jgi:hypothetical protein
MDPIESLAIFKKDYPPVKDYSLSSILVEECTPEQIQEIFTLKPVILI